MILFIKNEVTILKHNFEFIDIEGRQCYVFLPDDYKDGNKFYPVVYLNGDKSIFLLLKNSDFISKVSYIIVCIISVHRLNELTPSASPSLHPKFPYFGGAGNEYIRFIETKIKSTVDLMYRTLTLSKSTGIAGYSLGGLISIYAAFHTSCFGCFVSMSGSFWYPNFVAYVRNRFICNPEAKFYISSGDSEGVGQNDIKKDAVIYTKEIFDILVSYVTSERVTISWDKGGHHANVYQRYKDALLWLNYNLKYN